MRRLVLFLVFACQAVYGATQAQELASQVRAAELNPEDCYHVRDINLSREDLKFYLTEGVLIFGKPVGGRIISAVFSANVEGGDAEILTLPPTRGERISLAAFTGQPNFDEHFDVGLLLFTDDTAEELHKAIEEQGARKDAERGLLLASQYNSVLSNLSASFMTRLVWQLLAGRQNPEGLFYAALSSRRLGNFDVFYDPQAREQIYLGQLRYKDQRAYYDTWTSFQARSFREGRRKPLGWPFHLSNYRIHGELDSDLKLAVSTQVTLTAEEDLGVVALDIAQGMAVKSVRINGDEGELFTRESLRANLIRRNESAIFLVIPPRPLQKGRSYDLTFEHEGNVVLRAGGNVFYVGARGNWYPQAGADFSNFDMTFTYPSDLEMVFPGELKLDETHEGVRTTRRVTTSPIRIAGFNLGRYESNKITRGDLSVEVYANKGLETNLMPKPVIVLPPPTAPPRRGGQPAVQSMPITVMERMPDPTARLNPLANEVADIYQFLSERLGPPALPRLMVAPIPGGFGQGFPGLVYLSTISYLDEKDRPAAAQAPQTQVFFSALLHAHETAHQWWGNVVTATGREDEWLMEALANYSALYYLEKHNGAGVAAGLLADYKARLLAPNGDGKTVDSAGPLRISGRMEGSLTLEDWNAIVYGKGTWVLHMLRSRIGEENFLKLLGDICREYRHKPFSPGDLQRMAAVYVPKGSPDEKLDGFFEHWVEGTGIPSFELKTSTSGRAPNVKLTMTVTQSKVEDYVNLAVPVEVELARGRKETYWLLTAADPESVTVTVPTVPAKVTLDPGNTLLRQ